KYEHKDYSSHVFFFRCLVLLPSFHLITRSALASTLGGIVRPICFAAFRLMMNSNFFGCSTGRSAGLASFRFLSTLITGAPKQAGTAHAVRHKPSSLDKLRAPVYSRELVFGRQFSELFCIRSGDLAPQHKDCISTPLACRS